MDKSAGISGSMGESELALAAAGLGEVVLMRDLCMLRESAVRRSLKSRDFYRCQHMLDA